MTVMDNGTGKRDDEAGPERLLRGWSLRWRHGPEEIGYGPNAAAAALSLGYGFDDFKDLTWRERE